jgi:hypothetical protein
MTGPGVIVTTGAVAGPSSPTRAPSGTYFAVGQAERGPTDRAILVNSLSEFTARYGIATTYSTLYDDINMYFQEGGSRAYVARVVGPAATTGATATALQDRAVTPLATLNVAATSPGAWSSNVSLKVIDGSETNTFRIQVFYAGVLVEDHTNLHNPQEAVAKVNARSLYLKLTDAASATAVPGNNPAVTASPVAVTAGTDDRASITSTHYVTALGLFERGFGDGAVAVPGIGASVHAGLIAHADANNRLALLAAAKGADQATLTGLAVALNATRAGLFAPWVRVPDGFGGTKTIGPEGFVAAARSKAHEAVGPWKAAAGETSKASYVVAPDQVFTAAQASDLDGNKVSVIRTIAGAVRLYGWRSLSGDFDNWAYLTGADLVNRVVTEAEKQLEQYVFGVIDSSGHLLATVRGTLIGIVLPIASAGGLFARYDSDGAQLDPGYSVVTDATVNPVTSLALNQVLAKVGIRVSPVAALVRLDVTKAAVTAAL